MRKSLLGANVWAGCSSPSMHSSVERDDLIKPLVPAPRLHPSSSPYIAHRSNPTTPHCYASHAANLAAFFLMQGSVS